MNHSFNTEIAQEIGVIPAIMLEHIAFWVLKNKANQTNEKDGKYWTFATKEGFQSYFPYLTTKQIRYALDKLESEKYLETGCFNKSHFDRTKWYTLTEKAEKFYPMQDKKAEEKNPSVELPKLANRDDKIGKSDLPKLANRADKFGRPIPDINTDINKDIDVSPLNPPKGKTAKNAFNPIEYITSKNVSRQVAEDYVSHRNNLKAKVSKTVVDRLEVKALSAGYTLEDAMAEVCAQGWRGFFPPKVSAKQTVTSNQSVDDLIQRSGRLIFGDDYAAISAS